MMEEAKQRIFCRFCNTAFGSNSRVSVEVHEEYCSARPDAAVRRKAVTEEHTEKYKCLIVTEGQGKNVRFNYRCACGRDGKVWYSTKNAVWQAIAIHRGAPLL